MSQSCKKQMICLTIILSLFSLSASRGTLTPTQSLSDGETIISAGGTFTLGFFNTSNTNNTNRYLGIWYNNIPIQTVIWVANRHNPIDGLGGKLLVATDGTLIVTNGNSTVIWSSVSSSKVINPIAKLLDSGNFIVTGESYSENIAWQSFNYPTDTLVPGMKLGWNLISGHNCNLTAWSSATDPSPGNHVIAMDLRGDPQLIIWAGSKRKLRSGPWTGLDFSGLVPYNRTYTPKFTSNFVNNNEEVYFIVGVDKNSVITRLVLSPSGVLQIFIWLDSGQWVLYWYTPSSPCDSYLACGPYGAVCSSNGSPMCSCLPGFSPKMPANWDLRDWSGGCVRKMALDCRIGTDGFVTGTDGFVTVQRTLLPDTVSAVVYTRMSLNECKAECLKNCSCTAFASADTRGGGTGCIIWSTDLSDILVHSQGGQDLHMRLAAADIGNASINEANIAESTGETEIELPLFDLETIVAATNNFSSENKLGEGGFGPVFKGKMSEGQEIAVKRLSKNSVQGLDELKTEVILVAKLQHRNLVRLLGCCTQGDERMLIYEYMPNKSLDAFLFDEEKRALLDWRTRYRIILGIA